MYTQVTYAELVDNLLTKIGGPLGISFVQPSLPMLNSYENGKWMYGIHGISVEIFRWGRRGGGDLLHRDSFFIPGYHWSDEREAFERRLESDMRARVLSLMDEEELAKS